MTHNHHGHSGAISLFAIAAAIAFAFGVRTARIIVGGALLVATGFFGYVIFCVWWGMV